MYPDKDFFYDERTFIVSAGGSLTINLQPSFQVFLKSIEIVRDADVTVSEIVVNDKSIPVADLIDFISEYGDSITYKKIVITASNAGTADENIKVILKGIVRK